MENYHQIKETNARNKVKVIKKFYWFVGAAVFATFWMFGMAYFLLSQNASSTVAWIFAAGPLAWWIVVLIEYVRIFGAGLNFIKRWEEQQIRKVMKENEAESESERYR